MAGRNTKPRKLHWLDFVIGALVLAAAVFVVYRVGNVLNYRWNWNAIWPFVAYVDEDSGDLTANLLVHGLLTTLRLAVWGIIIAAIIGVLMGLARTSSNLFLRMLARTYVEFVRNMPPLVFIFIFYFFLSSQLMPLLGVDDFVRNASDRTLAVLNFAFGDPRLFSNFVAGLVCLGLFEAAYVTEIVRAGLQSIDRGQWEGARSIGLSPFDVLRYVIVPQAIQRIVPPLANQFITLVKDSSIISLISIQELTFMAVEVGVSTTRVFEVWITVAIAYFAVCYSCALVFGRLEKRMANMRS